jgi:hypothetical protein
MKVAQYPAAFGLRNDAKEMSVPPGTIGAFGSGSLACGCTSVSADRSSHSSFIPPSLRFGAAFKLRAGHSAKSEGGILTMADGPGRVAFSKKQPSTSYWATFIRSCRTDFLRPNGAVRSPAR